jgi:hypothetical protein
LKDRKDVGIFLQERFFSELSKDKGQHRVAFDQFLANTFKNEKKILKFYEKLPKKRFFFNFFSFQICF